VPSPHDSRFTKPRGEPSATINGITSPPLLLLIVLLSNRRSVMGKYTNRPWSNIFGWAAFLLMTVATVAYFVTLFI